MWAALQATRAAGTADAAGPEISRIAAAGDAAAMAAPTRTANDTGAKLGAVSGGPGTVRHMAEAPPPPRPSGAAPPPPADLTGDSSEFAFTAGAFGDGVPKAPSACAKPDAAPAGDADFENGDAHAVRRAGAASLARSGDAYIASPEAVGGAAAAYGPGDLESVPGNFAGAADIIQYDGAAPACARG